MFFNLDKMAQRFFSTAAATSAPLPAKFIAAGGLGLIPLTLNYVLWGKTENLLKPVSVYI